jgi:hypothetical protein
LDFSGGQIPKEICSIFLKENNIGEDQLQGFMHGGLISI